MPKHPIYTIGYGNRSFEEFAQLLKLYQIQYLIDVRTKPYSRHHKDFNKEVLEALLKNFRIRYVFMGDFIGGQPSEQSCYTNGRVDYEKLKNKQSFKDGLNRLRTAWEKNLLVALMCSEAKPQYCHRTKLIGFELAKRNIEIFHIDENGKAINQDEAILRITGGQENLFKYAPSALLYTRKRINNE